MKHCEIRGRLNDRITAYDCSMTSGTVRISFQDFLGEIALSLNNTI